MTIVDLYTIKTLLNLQSYPTTSPSLSALSEDFVATHCSTPPMQVVLPCFRDCSCVIDLPLHSGFQVLLFVAHAVCSGVDALQLAC